MQGFYGVGWVFSSIFSGGNHRFLLGGQLFGTSKLLVSIRKDFVGKGLR